MRIGERGTFQVSRKNKNGVLLLLLASICLTACDKQKEHNYPGYVQGKFTYISAYYSGILNKIHVRPGDTVTEGQPLFSLEPYPENTELQTADARVQQAIDEKNKYEANYKLQKANNDRNLMLFRKNVISREELETSNEALHSALANKNASNANLLALQAQQNKANWASGQKTVNSPITALVFDTYYSEHEKITGQQPVLSLLPSDAIKVIFYVPEPVLSHLKLKQELELLIDGRKQPIKAQISFISPQAEYTPPVIFSETQRHKLVFRVEARPVALGDGAAIHPGQPVTVTFISQPEQNSGHYGR